MYKETKIASFYNLSALLLFHFQLARLEKSGWKKEFLSFGRDLPPPKKKFCTAEKTFTRERPFMFLFVIFLLYAFNDFNYNLWV